MKPMLVVLGVMLILAGGTFALQGFSLLPGSFMTGRPEWAVIGLGGFIVGMLLLAIALSRRRA
jgi:hypothetical protein